MSFMMRMIRWVDWAVEGVSERTAFGGQSGVGREAWCGGMEFGKCWSASSAFVHCVTLVCVHIVALTPQRQKRQMRVSQRVSSFMPS